MQESVEDENIFTQTSELNFFSTDKSTFTVLPSARQCVMGLNPMQINILLLVSVPFLQINTPLLTVTQCKVMCHGLESHQDQNTKLLNWFLFLMIEALLLSVTQCKTVLCCGLELYAFFFLLILL